VSLGPRLPNPVLYSKGLTTFAINCPIATLLMGVSWYFCTKFSFLLIFLL
jgi:hypothetical protein